MPTLVYDPLVEKDLIEARRRNGLDRWDEVWEGAYVIMPMANNEHQLVATKLVAPLELAVASIDGGDVFAGVNVSDRVEDWTNNFRCPDLAVYLGTNPAENCGTHWYGGPDFAIEIVSPGDRSREKLDFYASIGTRELLLIDRDPWQLELYRLTDGELRSDGLSSIDTDNNLESQVLPLTWALTAGDSRPQIVVHHLNSEEHWHV